jgi:hypothetical protein
MCYTTYVGIRQRVIQKELFQWDCSQFKATRSIRPMFHIYHPHHRGGITRTLTRRIKTSSSYLPIWGTCFASIRWATRKEKRSVQTMIDFLVVDYPNDDPSKGGMQDGVSAIGQKISQFYKISMHTKANFYALAKAAFGGNIDPAWKPNRAELEGRYVVAQILHKDPDDQGRVYAKVGSVSPYRGKTNYDNVTATGASTDAEDDTEIPALAGEADNVPF